MIGSIFKDKLETLSQQERVGFYDFLNFDKPQQINRCKQTLKIYSELINKGSINNDELLLKKCLGSSGTEKQLRYTVSYLNKSLDKYFSWITLRDQTYAMEFARLEYYNKAGLNASFDKLAKHLKSEIALSSDESIDHYKYQMDLFRSIYVNRSRQGRTGEMYLSEWREATYKYFTTDLLRQQVLLHSYETHNPGYQDLYKQAINNLLQDVELTNSGRLYDLLKKVLVFNDSEKTVYEELSKVFKNQIHLFQKYEAKNILLILINFCIKQINEGATIYQQYCLDWYRWGLDQDILLDDNYVSKYTYKNMLSLTIKFSDFDEGYRILDTYKGLLSEQERDEVYNFNFGRLLFHQKRYQEAMRILQIMDSPSLMDNLDVRRMLLRMYYEEGDFDLLDSHLVSFGSFLRRHKELGYHRVHYINLVKFTSKLIRTRSHTRRQVIRESISKCPSLVDKKWLLSMI